MCFFIFDDVQPNDWTAVLRSSSISESTLRRHQVIYTRCCCQVLRKSAVGYSMRDVGLKATTDAEFQRFCANSCHIV